MGGFHIALNFLALLGKKYQNSGIEDLLIESGVYGSGTATAVVQQNHPGSQAPNGGTPPNDVAGFP